MIIEGITSPNPKNNKSTKQKGKATYIKTLPRYEILMYRVSLFYYCGDYYNFSYSDGCASMSISE